MKSIIVRVWHKQPDGQVVKADMELPTRTGDEGFAFLKRFETQCGGPVRDAERDRRWLELKAKIEAGKA